MTGLYKGLVPKYSVRPWGEGAAECRRLNAVRIDYAQDVEGRLWRRIVRQKRGWAGHPWTETVRWHVADMYEWFPGMDPSTIAGARRQNTRARPPKVDVYLVDGKPLVLERDQLD